jgi:hypothetical protein
MRADGARDQTGARFDRSESAANRTASLAARGDRQMLACLVLASAVREGGQGVHGHPCAKHGARALSPDRLHALHEGLPQGSQRARSGRAAGPTI